MHEKIMEGYDEFNAYVIVTRYKTSTHWRFKRPENGYPKTKVVNIYNYNFFKDMDSGTQGEAGNPQIITRQRRR